MKQKKGKTPKSSRPRSKTPVKKAKKATPPQVKQQMKRFAKKRPVRTRTKATSEGHTGRTKISTSVTSRGTRTPTSDIYQERADRDGITRQEAKTRMMAEMYSGQPKDVALPFGDAPTPSTIDFTKPNPFNIKATGTLTDAPTTQDTSGRDPDEPF